MITHDIAESITLSDEVIILSKRPAIVKKRYLINIDKNLSFIEKRKTSEFNRYYELIWSDLDENI